MRSLQPSSGQGLWSTIRSGRTEEIKQMRLSWGRSRSENLGKNRSVRTVDSVLRRLDILWSSRGHYIEHDRRLCP
ncbi:hypothetical protein DOTSEDRAFT_73006 [Dothistroma septosporum NZE10]|uniref:Uncharacterized protein n=1 Tax=Dothistroma septosporum (strain NZE10 / CBS 128990) TaxID=675120 RepID=N1PI82_DOTSN|nr:hypothetical protein DOTSEDRAFT_73006 [Dothistroma septosporum NZE10]